MDLVLIFLTNVIELDLFCTKHVNRSSLTFRLFLNIPVQRYIQFKTLRNEIVYPV